MINTWFISDTHFGHKNIIEYEKEYRPFSTLDEMHEVMIERWNDVVKPKDTVYHLGDFAFGRRNIKIASRLNGRKRLIMGNHDTYPAIDYLAYFDKLYGCVFWERCVLSHMPLHPNGLGARWILNVHGHLHSRRVQSLEIETDFDLLCESPASYKEDKNYFNVSCEQNNLTPIHRDVIMERIKELDK